MITNTFAGAFPASNYVQPHFNLADNPLNWGQQASTSSMSLQDLSDQTAALLKQKAEIDARLKASQDEDMAIAKQMKACEDLNELQGRHRNCNEIVLSSIKHTVVETTHKK